MMKKKILKFKNNKDILKQLPKSSMINVEIINYLTQSRNDKALMEILNTICDEICDVTKDEHNHKTNSNKKGSKQKTPNDKDDNDDNDDLILSASKAQTTISFQEKFYLYFIRLTQQKSNIKGQLKTFLTIILFQIGIFHKIRIDRTSPSIVAFAAKCKKLNLIELCVCDEFGQTLFHFSAGLDNTDLLSILLSIDSDVTKYKNKVGKTAGDEAIKHGQWSVVKQIALARMGSKMKNQAKLEEKRIESQRGIASQFLKQRQTMGYDIDDDVLLEQLLLTVIKLIEQMLPVSDDMLMVCWKYEMEKSNGNEKENRLWNVLKTTVEYVLDHSKNKRNWIWYEFFFVFDVWFWF